nr:hypothetical protein [Tanacetum cinerariifolium]
KWYPVSKTLAEKSAWEFAEKNGLDLVTILPSTCLGRLLQPTLNASCAVLQQLLLGSRNTQEYHWWGAVNGIYQFGEFSQKVSRLFPEFDVHRFEGETQPGMLSVEDAAKRLIDLGMVFKPVEDAVKETVECLKSKGFLSHKVSLLVHN